MGEIRDYIEECLRASSDHQYSRALQDLVNYIGHFLGFEIAFGRYQGVQGQVGFDGHWQSSTGFHVVVEVKTSETYPIKTLTLVNYVDALISERQLPDWDHALGLYVIGKPHPEIRQLEHAILAEGRTHQLRIISVESLLSLAELMNEYDVSHDDTIGVLRPSGPMIDSIVDLMARLVAQREAETLPASAAIPEKPPVAASDTQVAPKGRATEDKVEYWLTPVRSDETATAEDVIQKLIGTDGIYGFSERTPGRKHLKPGDWIAFYATGKGVVAHAKIMSLPEHKSHPSIRHPERYPWVFQVEDPSLYLDEPIVVDATVRSQLNAFDGRDVNTSWAWFVQSTSRVSAHDFDMLTGREAMEPFSGSSLIQVHSDLLPDRRDSFCAACFGGWLGYDVYSTMRMFIRGGICQEISVASYGIELTPVAEEMDEAVPRFCHLLIRMVISYSNSLQRSLIRKILSLTS